MEIENNKKIVLSEEIQRKMLKFFLKTSIPRKIRQDKLEQETLSEKKGQDKK